MKKLLLTKLFLLLTFTGIYAQQLGEIDPTFNVNNGIGANNDIYDVSVQQDGKTIMVGAFTQYGDVPKNRICRLNLDGTIDTSFNMGTGFNTTVTDVIIQSDGKIVVLLSGFSFSYNNVACGRIARLNTNGTLDATFVAGTFANGGFSIGLRSIAIQADGKIIVGGIFSTYNGVAAEDIARLNVDGSLDTTFATTIARFQLIQLIVVQPNAKILVVGQLTGSGQTGTIISRLNVDGSLESTFNSSVIGNINDVQVQADNKILIVGSFSQYQSTPRNNIARLNANGSLDSTFDPGTGTNSIIDNMQLLSNGKMIISGSFSIFNGVARNRIASLNADGSLDTTFDIGANGNFFPDPIQDANRIIEKVTEKPNGKIIIVGKFIAINGTSRGRLAQLNTDGTIDTTFFSPSGFNSGANNSIVSAALQADGKILAAGAFTNINNVPKIGIFRLDANGILDVPFNPATSSGGTQGAVEYCIVVQTNGKILLAGRHGNINGVVTGRLIRLNPESASVDTTLSGGDVSNTNGDVFTIALQPNGKFLVGGVFSTYNGVTRNRIARLNIDGSIDTTFDPLLRASNAVNTIVVQPDGKILIGGNFTTYNGISRNRIARLNVDGTLDTNFANGTGANNEINAIALQTDGKILIGGFFTTYNGNAKKHVARLNSDGSLDVTFGLGTGPNGRVRSVKIKLDEKIIIAGDFTSYDGTSKNRITFLNADGTLDTNFNIGTGANNTIRDILIQPDGQIIIAGDFTSYNGISVGRIARLTSTPIILAVEEFTQKSFTIFPNPSTGIFTIQTENPISNATITVADLNGRIVHASKVENLEFKALDLNYLQNGIYILNISNGENKYSQKIIKQ